VLKDAALKESDYVSLALVGLHFGFCRIKTNPTTAFLARVCHQIVCAASPWSGCILIFAFSGPVQHQFLVRPRPKTWRIIRKKFSDIKVRAKLASAKVAVITKMD
jgi:hypothetical protein